MLFLFTRTVWNNLHSMYMDMELCSGPFFSLSAFRKGAAEAGTAAG